MDMEVDVPNPDELEWLEANSHLYEEPPDPFLEPQSPPLSPPSPPAADSRTTNGHKRSRFQNPPNQQNEAVQSNEKRSKINDFRPPPPQEEDDEDWLRYSPQLDPRQQEERCCAGEATIVESVAVEEEEEEERILSRYASEIDGDFIPVTAPSGGDRVYAKICRLEKEQRSKKLATISLSNGLIAEPINVLMQKVEQEAFTKALKASSEVQSDVVLPEAPVVREQLWVDKYAPSSFTELLSDEQTNREVLLWLKQWDSCVFGSEVRSTSDEVLSALRRHSSVSHHPKPTVLNFSRKDSRYRFGNGRSRYPDSSNPENSESKVINDLWNKKSRFTGPPEQKILLLCGPPGLGKTTLAHVAAKHCGYRAVEVNASDDRSSSTIEAKILDVVQMNSVTVDSRPKCLVIDEIDGALGDGKGAVDVILKMVSSDRKADTGKENVLKGDQSRRVPSKRGHKNASLSRPVICICNDLYAPVLRPLRQVAKVHIFVRPTVSRVVSRLKYICHKEGMKTSSIALTALAEYTECDIRSCLNTLQFLDKKKETLNTSEIGAQVVGRKDMSRSAFDIWKEIFQQRKMKRTRKSAGNFGSRSNELDFLHSLISHRGDYDVILDGIHENILHLGYHDPVMQKTVKCFNSLGISDLMHQFIMRTQQMSLHAYQPFLAISVHRCIAQVQKPNIEWPKSYQRYRTTLMEKMDILMTWQNKILPHISRHLSPKSFVVDLVSPLLHILSPSTLRPVALHLLSEKEKIDLAQLVSTMVSYSVTYKNMKSDPPSSNQQHEATLDASAFSFDPPISDFINFKGYNSAHYVLPTAMKQVLVHEVEMQKILQVSKYPILVDGCKKENLHLVGSENNEIRPPKTDLATAFSANMGMKKSFSTARQFTPNTSTTLSALESGKSKSSVNSKKHFGGSINFFDRFRKASGKGSSNADNAVEKTTLSERDSRPLLFKFNEGFTNAVKRPVRMREFLQW